MLERGMAAALTAAAALLVGAAQAQPVYKWVDAQGRTQYGSQPPDLETAQQPRLHNLGPGASGGGGAAPSKKLPKEVQAQVEDMTRGLLKTQPGTPKLSCSVAVSNATYGLDTMLETGEKNMRDGYMTREKFDATAQQIRSTRGQITVGDCESSTGAKRAFYQCMSSNTNHVLGCAQQHRF